MTLSTKLSVTLDVFLGVTAEEQKQLQSVVVCFEFTNNQKQQCFSDDKADDYICYQKLTQEIYRKFYHQKVRLLEYLCYQIYLIVKNMVSEGSMINVSVQKTCRDIVKEKDAIAICRYIEFQGSI